MAEWMFLSGDCFSAVGYSFLDYSDFGLGDCSGLEADIVGWEPPPEEIQGGIVGEEQGIPEVEMPEHRRPPRPQFRQPRPGGAPQFHNVPQQPPIHQPHQMPVGGQGHPNNVVVVTKPQANAQQPSRDCCFCVPIRPGVMIIAALNFLDWLIAVIVMAYGPIGLFIVFLILFFFCVRSDFRGFMGAHRSEDLTFGKSVRYVQSFYFWLMFDLFFYFILLIINFAIFGGAAVIYFFPLLLRMYWLWVVKEFLGELKVKFGFIKETPANPIGASAVYPQPPIAAGQIPQQQQVVMPVPVQTHVPPNPNVYAYPPQQQQYVVPATQHQQAGYGQAGMPVGGVPMQPSGGQYAAYGQPAPAPVYHGYPQQHVQGWVPPQQGDHKQQTYSYHQQS